MSKSVSILIEKKNEGNQRLLLPAEGEESTIKAIFLGFLFYWVFGSILVSIATSMVRASVANSCMGQTAVHMRYDWTRMHLPESHSL